MDDFLMMTYLKEKGLGHMSEEEFVSKFKEFMGQYSNPKYTRHTMPMDYNHEHEYMMRRHNMYMPDDYLPEDDYSNSKYNRSYNSRYRRDAYMNMYPEHFNEAYAKYIVSNMFHHENGKKHIGEYFSMDKAKEICNQYKQSLPYDVTHSDVYVALNAQYHDYNNLFRSWFGRNVDTKIIDSAIVFWFKDEDNSDGTKLWNYFKEV